MKILTVSEYANLMGYDGKNPSIMDVQEFCENEQDLSVWDYPLDELEYVLTEVNENIVFVKEGNEVRICEC